MDCLCHTCHSGHCCVNSAPAPAHPGEEISFSCLCAEQALLGVSQSGQGWAVKGAWVSRSLVTLKPQLGLCWAWDPVRAPDSGGPLPVGDAEAARESPRAPGCGQLPVRFRHLWEVVEDLSPKGFSTWNCRSFLDILSYARDVNITVVFLPRLLGSETV